MHGVGEKIFPPLIMLEPGLIPSNCLWNLLPWDGGTHDHPLHFQTLPSKNVITLLLLTPLNRFSPVAISYLPHWFPPSHLPPCYSATAFPSLYTYSCHFKGWGERKWRERSGIWWVRAFSLASFPSPALCLFIMTGREPQEGGNGVSGSALTSPSPSLWHYLPDSGSSLRMLVVWLLSLTSCLRPAISVVLIIADPDSTAALMGSACGSCLFKLGSRVNSPYWD